jgi:hypothetical protein
VQHLGAPINASYQARVTDVAVSMDALLQTLRFFAIKPDDPNCVILGELRMREYLKGATASLQRLSSAIDKEVRATQGDNSFWIKMQKLIRSQAEE